MLEGGEHWELSLERAAAARTTRVSVILLQKLIRAHPDIYPNLVPLLPPLNALDEFVGKAICAGYGENELDRFTSIIDCSTDGERCERFLEDDSFKPAFLAKYLLRKTNTLGSVETLNQFLDYWGLWFDRREWAHLETAPLTKARHGLLLQNTCLTNINEIAGLLATQCLRLEPRLLVKLAGVVAAYIESIASSGHQPERTYITQCSVLNESLALFHPSTNSPPSRGSFPNRYLWEAQQILLALSSNFANPLLIDKRGFQSIRKVLAGQAKNRIEKHNTGRQAPSWPPYLQPVDGRDEHADPEHNWSRTIQAGVMMQEAGFPKGPWDEGLDILQGLGSDGTPTIQHRTMRKTPMPSWAAAIKATRNAQEAWQLFQSPPETGLVAGPLHYALMFEKLLLREVEPASRNLPGDKAANFPIYTEHNLTEVEKARLQPPSLEQLYEQMLDSGVAPEGPCLRLLVANAETMQLAHRYLSDSNYPAELVRCLVSPDPNPSLVRKVHVGLVIAYTEALTRVKGPSARGEMMRAIHLISAHLPKASPNFVPFLWAPILKGLSQHHITLGITIPEQLELVLQIFEQVEKTSGVTLPVFTQLGKCIRKIARRELTRLLSDLSSDRSAHDNPLRYLYDRDAWMGTEVPLPLQSPSEGHSGNMVLSLLMASAKRMKQNFNDLADQESKMQELLAGNGVPALDRMVVRRDPVKAEHIHEYMVTLAFVGEYEEMEKALGWLIMQWAEPDVLEEMLDLDEPPPYADFTDTLCIFRMLAEPMLGVERTEALRETIAEAGVGWLWPDDEAVERYAEAVDDEVIKLERVYQWTQYNKSREAEEEEH